MADFEMALQGKERRESRRELFEAVFVKRYERYGASVEAADRARAIHDSDVAAYVNGADVDIVDGRIVLVPHHVE